MRGWKFVVLALALAIALPRAATAQGQPSKFIQVNSIVVKLGMHAEFEDYLKKIIAAGVKTNNTQRLITQQVAMGGPPMMYFVSSPFETWGEADALESAPAILAKAHGELEAAKIIKAGRATLESLETIVYELLPNLSTNPKAFMPPLAHTFAVRTEVDLGMQAEYRHYLSMLKAAQEKDPNSPTAIRRVSVVGPAGVFVTTQPFNKFADRDGLPNTGDLLRKAYGDAEAQLVLGQATRGVKSRVTYVLNYRPDLSRATIGTTSN